MNFENPGATPPLPGLVIPMSEYLWGRTLQRGGEHLWVCRNAVTGAGEADREVLAGTAPVQSAPGQQPPANGGGLPLPPALNLADQKRMLKAQKKAEKEKRRAEKKVCCHAEGSAHQQTPFMNIYAVVFNWVNQ